MKKGPELSDEILKDIKQNVEEIVLDRYAEGMVRADSERIPGEEAVFDVSELIDSLVVDIAIYVENLLQKIT